VPGSPSGRDWSARRCRRRHAIGAGFQAGAEAADGIRNLAVVAGGTTRQDIADAMAGALASRDRRLRAEVLQALFQVAAPLPLAPLLGALSDSRQLFEDYRICDNALWILERQLGLQLVDADGR
jgi:hypothetical protein